MVAVELGMGKWGREGHLYGQQGPVVWWPDGSNGDANQSKSKSNQIKPNQIHAVSR